MHAMHHLLQLTLSTLHEAREELFEPQHIVSLSMLDKLHNARFTCTKITELRLQLFAVDVASLAQDSPLECCCFLQNAANLSITSTELRSRNERPWHWRKSGENKSVEAREGRVRRSSGCRRYVWATPDRGHSCEHRQSETRGGRVCRVLRKVCDGGQESVESALIGWADEDGAKVVVEDDENEVEILQLELLQLNLVICARDRNGQAGEYLL
jgi:hypothetical protein